jgi:hypothetical protein
MDLWLRGRLPVHEYVTAFPDFGEVVPMDYVDAATGCLELESEYRFVDYHWVGTRFKRQAHLSLPPRHSSLLRLPGHHVGSLVHYLPLHPSLHLHLRFRHLQLHQLLLPQIKNLAVTFRVTIITLRLLKVALMQRRVEQRLDQQVVPFQHPDHPL